MTENEPLGVTMRPRLSGATASLFKCSVAREHFAVHAFPLCPAISRKVSCPTSPERRGCSKASITSGGQAPTKPFPN